MAERYETTQPCLFCGGEIASLDHWLTCDGRQGHIEAEEPAPDVAPRLDPVLGTQLREEAIERVEAHAAEDFKETAYAAVYATARRYQTFTTDQVWLAIDIVPHEPRAMGAVMRQATKDGLVRPTDAWALSAWSQCHRRPKRVWESRIYDGGCKDGETGV